ncbi:uncharacterized protein C2orf81 homolog [Pungitius pungitius]|uniref:uncharacterized protein C2orf81 homolog n=1 Tax=Pungitius pungitius TaxID=134920 RepID=UPI002E111641
MPRSAAKLRADNQSRRSIQLNTPPTEELELDDIIPVVLTHVQWTEMLIQEDSDEAVGEIMEELLSEVMEGCFKVSIKRQVMPFSVSWAKSYLTQIVEQHILCPDEGGVPEKTSKTEDTEPMPPPSDPWVKRCVPIGMASPRHHTASQQDDDIVQVPVQAKPGVNQKCDIMAPTKRSPKKFEKKTRPIVVHKLTKLQTIVQVPVQAEPGVKQQCDIMAPTKRSPKKFEKKTRPIVVHKLTKLQTIVQVPVQAEPEVKQQCDIMAPTKRSPKKFEKQTSPTTRLSSNCQQVLSPFPPPKMNQKKKQRVNLPPILKTPPSKSLPSPSCSAEKKDVDVDFYNYPTGSLYQLKRNQPIQKLDYSCLPRPCICPQYEIVDEKLTKPDSRIAREHSTLKQGYNKRKEWTVTSPKQLSSSTNQLTKFQKGNQADIWQDRFPRTGRRKDCMVSSGSLRLDTMVLAKGVSLLDSQAVERNPLISNSSAEPTKLMPIRSDIPMPRFSVDQVTSGPPPQVTPLCEMYHKMW